MNSFQTTTPTPTAYQWKFGEYLSEAFELVMKKPLHYAGFAFIFYAISFVISLIAAPVSSLIAPVYTAGIAIFTHQLKYGRDPSFEAFFKAFDHIGQLLVLALIQLAIVIGVFMVFGILAFIIFGGSSMLSGGGFDGMESMLGGGILIFALLMAIPLIYITVAWSFGVYYVVFHGLSAWNALEASRKVISANWFIVFLFAIVTAIIAGLGTLALVIGLLITVPVAGVAFFVAFDDVVGTVPEAKTAVDHLVE